MNDELNQVIDQEIKKVVELAKKTKEEDLLSIEVLKRIEILQKIKNAQLKITPNTPEEELIDESIDPKELTELLLKGK